MLWDMDHGGMYQGNRIPSKKFDVLAATYEWHPRVAQKP
jgi:hypothetical protein